MSWWGSTMVIRVCRILKGPGDTKLVPVFSILYVKTIEELTTTHEIILKVSRTRRFPLLLTDYLQPAFYKVSCWGSTMVILVLEFWRGGDTKLVCTCIQYSLSQDYPGVNNYPWDYYEGEYGQEVKWTILENWVFPGRDTSLWNRSSHSQGIHIIKFGDLHSSKPVSISIFEW